MFDGSYTDTLLNLNSPADNDRITAVWKKIYGFYDDLKNNNFVVIYDQLYGNGAFAKDCVFHNPRTLISV